MIPSRFAFAAVLALGLIVTASAAPQSEQARIDQAVRAYAKKLQAAQDADRDQRVAVNASALQDDPASPVIGNPKATTAIIEFFDYDCPYCKAVEPRLEAAIRADKNAKLVLKEFPILSPASMVATRIALAAAKQGKYTAFHQALMNYRGELDAAAINDAIATAHLDTARLRRDMDSPDVTNEIIANFNLARALRIFQTPGFIVGGHVLSSDSASIDFRKELAAAHR